MAHAVDAMERATFGLLLRLLTVYLKVCLLTDELILTRPCSLFPPLPAISSLFSVPNSVPSFAHRSKRLTRSSVWWYAHRVYAFHRTDPHLLRPQSARLLM